MHTFTDTPITMNLEERLAQERDYDSEVEEEVNSILDDMNSSYSTSSYNPAHHAHHDDEYSTKTTVQVISSNNDKENQRVPFNLPFNHQNYQHDPSLDFSIVSKYTNGQDLPLEFSSRGYPIIHLMERKSTLSVTHSCSSVTSNRKNKNCRHEGERNNHGNIRHSNFIKRTKLGNEKQGMKHPRSCGYFCGVLEAFCMY